MRKVISSFATLGQCVLRRVKSENELGRLTVTHLRQLSTTKIGKLHSQRDYKMTGSKRDTAD